MCCGDLHSYRALMLLFSVSCCSVSPARIACLDMNLQKARLQMGVQVGHSQQAAEAEVGAAGTDQDPAESAKGLSSIQCTAARDDSTGSPTAAKTSYIVVRVE